MTLYNQWWTKFRKHATYIKYLIYGTSHVDRYRAIQDVVTFYLVDGSFHMNSK